MNIRKTSIAALLLISLAILFSFPVAADILINEFLADGAVEPGSEWIELYNNGTENVFLGDYKISDATSDSNKTLHNLSIGSKAFVVLVRDSATFNSTYSHFANVTQIEYDNFTLNNAGGDVISLYNNTGGLIDSINYSGTQEGRSIGRFPDASTSITELSIQTPGINNDNQTPSITLVSPTGNLNTTASVLVNATITDNHAVQAVNMTLRDGSGLILALAPSVDGSSYSALINSSLIADGQYNISITANDSTGNTARLNSTLSLDRVAPEAVIIQPSNNSFVNTWSLPVIVNISDATTGSWVSSINSTSFRYRPEAFPSSIAFPQLLVSQKDGAVIANATTSDFGSNEYQVEVTLSLQDHAGNTLTGFSWNYTVDQNAPSVNSVTLNDSDSILRPGDPLNILVNISDVPAGAASANISAGTNVPLTITSDTGWEANTTATALGCASDGDCTVTIIAVDNAGNVNNSKTFTLTVDNTAPVILSTALNATNNKTRSASPILFNVTINETSAGSAASVTLSNGSSVSLTKTSSSGDLSSWTGTATAQSLGCPSADGLCAIHATAMDDAGNTASTTSSLIVDDAAPGINSLVKNATGTLRNITILKITANVTDSNTISSVTLNGTPLSSAGGDLWTTTNVTGDLCPGILDSSCVLGLTAVDELGNTNSTETLSFTISTFAPVISGIPDVTFSEDGHNATLNLSLYVTDQDTAPQDLTWSVLGTTNTTVTINQTTKLANISADPDFNGAENIVFLASDGVNSDSDTISVTVTAVNDAPEAPALVSPANNSAPSAASVTLDWDTSIDADGDSLTYYVAFGSDSTPEINATTQDTNLTITNLSKGATYQWLVFASDGQANSSNSTLFQFTSVNNNAPVNNGSIPNVTWAEDTSDSSLDLDGYFSDSDGDNLTYNATAVSGISITINQSTGQVTLTPAGNFSGSRTTIFSANDGTNSTDSNQVTLTVTDVNDAPTIDSFSPLSDPSMASDTGSQIFTATFSDVDSASSYTAAWTRDGSSIAGNATNVTVSSLAAGSYNITVIVTDNSSLSARKEWTLTVSSDINSSEYSSNVLSLNESERQSVSNAVINDTTFGGLDFTGSTLNFSGITSLEQAFNISRNLVSVDTDTYPGLNGSAFIVMKGLNFTKAPLIQTASGFESTAGSTECSLSLCSNRTYDVANGILRFRAAHFTTFFAQTNNTNGAPLIISSAKTSANAGATYRYDVEASDPDGDTLTYSLTENPSGMSISSSSGEITWQPTEAQLGTHNVTVQASDGSLSDSQNFQVDVSKGPKLVIEDIEVEVGDRRDSSVENNSRISREARPGDEVVFQVEVGNAFSDEEDLEIEDIEVSITIQNIDDGDDLDEDSDQFDLRQGRSKTEDIEFTIPLLVDEDEYDVEIVVEGEDQNGTEHRIFYNVILEVEKEDHELRLRQADIYPRIIACEESTTARVQVINTGQEDEDDAVLEVRSDRLDILQGRLLFSIEEGDDEDDSIYSRDVPIGIPDDLPLGQYPVFFTTYYDGSTESDSSQVMVEKVRCAQREETEDTPDTLTPPDQDIVAPPSTQQPVQQQPVQQEQSFRDSDAYIFLLATMLLTLTMVLFLIVAAAVIRLR